MIGLFFGCGDIYWEKIEGLLVIRVNCILKILNLQKTLNSKQEIFFAEGGKT